MKDVGSIDNKQLIGMTEAEIQAVIDAVEDERAERVSGPDDGATYMETP